MQAGAQEARASNLKFVNLRLGKIAQTSNEQLPGFVPATTRNKSGTENHFFAKPYDSIVGYIDQIKWHTHTLPDSTVLSGWNIEVNTGTDVFVLHISTNDRPFDHTMNVLCNVDFNELVGFRGFMGSNQDKSKKQKVLLIKQEGPEGEELNVQGAFESKWLSQNIVKKLKEKIELTEDEKKNVAYTEDGKINGDYPYIKQLSDGKWSFELWREFLMEQMQTRVLPAVDAAKEHRGSFTIDTTSEAITVTEDDDDSIPF